MENFHNLCNIARAADQKLEDVRRRLIEKINQINNSPMMYAKNRMDLETMAEVAYIQEKTVNTRIPGIHRDFNKPFIKHTFDMTEDFRGKLYIHKSVDPYHIKMYKNFQPSVPRVTNVLIKEPRGG